MPAWIKEGFEDYQARLPKHIRLSLREIGLPERTSKSDIQRMKQEEGERLLSGVQQDDLVIALDEHGQQWDSRQLAQKFNGWLEDRRDISLLIGGPDGLSDSCLQRADMTWSFSKATLPHMMVRVILAEQLYRAWTILQGHPYHR